MVATAACPKCAKLVSLPDGAVRDVQVRCPLCHAEYPLGSLQPSVPPKLILLTPSTSATAGAKSPTEEKPPARVTEKGKQPSGAVHVPASSTEEHPIISSLASFAYSRPKRPRKSALRTVVEIVAGGVAGCVVAYYALAIYFGPRFHQLGLPWANRLPFIQRLTAPRGNNQDEDIRQKPRNSRVSKPAARSFLQNNEEPLVVQYGRKPNSWAFLTKAEELAENNNFRVRKLVL